MSWRQVGYGTEVMVVPMNGPFAGRVWAGKVVGSWALDRRCRQRLKVRIEGSALPLNLLREQECLWRGLTEENLGLTEEMYVLTEVVE